MAREIKFRVWDPDLCRMHYDDCTILIDSSDGIVWKNIFKENAIDNLIATDWILMQYTGLKDKNGKEVYEGDLLRGFGNEVKWFRVEFHNGSFELYNKFARWGLLSRIFDVDFKDLEIEVIGNIYENPELLK